MLSAIKIDPQSNPEMEECAWKPSIHAMFDLSGVNLVIAYLCGHENIQTDISHSAFGFAAPWLDGGFSGEG